MDKFPLHIEVQQLHVLFGILKDVFVKIVKSDIVDILVSRSVVVNEVGDYVEIKTVFHGGQQTRQIVQRGSVLLWSSLGYSSHRS